MVDKLRLEVLLAAVDKVSGPLRTVAAGSKATAQAVGQAEAAIKKLQAQQRALARFEKERDQLDNARSMLEQAKAANASRAVVRQLTADYEKQLAVVKRLQADMANRGWGDARVDQQQLASAIKSANTQLDAQRHKVEQQRQVEERLATLREKHSKAMVKLGAWGATGVGLQMAGAKARAPLQAAIKAFMPAEDAEAQLGASLMRADGTVPASMQQMLDLSTKLGDRLPGNTKDFTELMQALSQEGLSDKTILGGTAEAAAYLAVQLKKVPKEAATMAAKMQDATRATESEMMGVLDMVQRGHYAGADADYMLSGFTKLAPVLDITRKKGMEVMNALSPMMVMMNQAGMVDGASAGNAIRKVFQASMDAKKLGKANSAVKSAGGGFTLDFSDGRGEFGGIEQLFKQLNKLQKLNTMQRGSVIKELFGDDAETLQVVNTLMNKGIDGYEEAAKKLADQASLQQRVNEQLKTLRNAAEAADGSFTNMLAALGKSIAPELKQLLRWLAELANAVGGWARKNPRATKALALTAAATAALLSAMGALVIGIVAVLGPLHMARFLLGRWLLNLAAARIAAQAAAPAMGLLYRAGFMLGRAFTLLRAGAGLLLGGMRVLAAFLIANPIVLAIGLLAAAGYMLYSRWQDVVGGFKLLMQDIGAAVSGAAQYVWGLGAQFFEAGAAIVQGMANGITSRITAVRDAISMAAGDSIDWFKQQLGIHSPSRVFMRLGEHVTEGAAIGMQRGSGMVRAAALGMVTATMAPMAAVGAPAAAAPTMGGSTYQITVNAAPGMDAQAIARAVSAELDRRERERASRRYSALADID
ncbi:phage tail tape measure protein [Melaminivora sp.]|uniref:phage tail tape measure protein n=1 Tax=Melaminivora sp. TaxID=1933032 RepID=UPI0028B1554F|nr:phage tail tape measure protein [Melaminivora sp.]